MERITFKSRDGAEISAVCTVPAREKIKGAVVICHGFGEHSGSYRELMEKLGGDGFASVTFDQRGHGQIDGKLLGRLPSYESFMDDLEAVANECKRRWPGLALALYGHSMGGNIAANFLIRRKHSFCCCVLEAPWLGLWEGKSQPPQGLVRAMAALMPNLPLPEKLTKLALGDITGDPQKQKEMEDDPLYHNRMTLRMIAEITASCGFAGANADKIDIPTFLAYASGEKIVSNSAIFAFLKANAGSVRGEEYDSCHSIHNDRNREKFFADILAFLEENCAGK